MRKILLGFCLLFLLTVPSLAENTDDQVLSAARSFAELIDDGNFQAAYWNGSPLLQLANPEQVWLDSVERNQRVLGKVLSRELNKIRSVTSFAKLPDDNYQIVLFASRTMYKAEAHETLFLHQVDGIWQVCSYKVH